MKSKTRVILIENIDPFRARSGGIGTYLKNLTLFLREKGVFTSLIGAGQTMEESELRIPVDEFIPVTTKKRGHPFYIMVLLFKARKLAREPGAILHGQRPDVLFPFAVLNRRWRRKNNQKTICSLHGIHGPMVTRKKGKLRGKIYQWLERKTLEHVDAVIAAGKNVADYFTGKYPFCKEKLTMLPTGVNDKLFYPRDKQTQRRAMGLKESARILIFVGRLEKEKNLFLLVDAFALVKEKVPEAMLLLVGSGREEKRLKDYVAKNVAKKGGADIIFKGSMVNEEIPLLLNCADVFTFCSVHEGSPTVIREALACNLPVVSTDVGDVRALIETLPGCFISEPEPKEFSQKIMSSLSHNDPRDYRLAISDYKNETIFNKTLSLYFDLEEENKTL